MFTRQFKESIKRYTLSKHVSILAITAFLASATQALTPIYIHIQWNPVPEVDGYEIFGSNDLTLSWSNWPMLSYVAGQSTTNYYYPMIASKLFIYVKSSNFWGESDPSIITNTPIPPQQPTVKITR